MKWNLRQSRYTLALFLLVFFAGQAKACLTRPVFPAHNQIPEKWPPKGCLIDATALNGRALEVFPKGTVIADALARMNLKVAPTGSGFCLPRAGILIKSPNGWGVRPMSQGERWAWRIPMDLYACEPVDLQRIKGIGPSLAQKIFTFVKTRGHLESMTELDEVPGIGPGKLKILERDLELP